MDIALSDLKAKVVEEVNLLPDERLVDLYNFLHYFRLGSEHAMETKHAKTQKIMALAGSWADLPEEEYIALMDEIHQRRQFAFSGRRAHESSLD